MDYLATRAGRLAVTRTSCCRRCGSYKPATDTVRRLSREIGDALVMIHALRDSSETADRLGYRFIGETSHRNLPLPAVAAGRQREIVEITRALDVLRACQPAAGCSGKIAPRFGSGSPTNRSRRAWRLIRHRSARKSFVPQAVAAALVRTDQSRWVAMANESFSSRRCPFLANSQVQMGVLALRLRDEVGTPLRPAGQRRTAFVRPLVTNPSRCRGNKGISTGCRSHRAGRGAGPRTVDGSRSPPAFMTVFVCSARATAPSCLGTTLCERRSTGATTC